MNRWIPAWAGLLVLVSGDFGRGDETTFEVVAGVRQLFLDDQGIERRENVRTTMHRPVKRGAVLRSPDPSRTLQTRSAPAWDPVRQRYLIWVLSIQPNVWESHDGLNWASTGTSNIPIEMAVLDPDEKDAARRFKAPLRNEGFATSADGLHWSKLDVPRIPSSDEANFSHDPGSGLFVHTVKRGGPHGRSLAIAVSRDFREWTDLGVVFHADDEDQARGRANITARVADPALEPLRYVDNVATNVDVYNMGVFRYEGVYIGLPTMFHSTGRVPNYPNTDGFDLIQLAFSRDLKSWTRLGDRQPFLGPSRTDSGAYDLTQLLSPSAPVAHDDELWFYYTGLKYRSSFDYQGTYPNGTAIPVPGRSRDIGAVCLAVLRRDGFISLDAGEAPGVVVTRRFELPAGRLFINVDARGGEFRAEMVSEDGKALARSRVVASDAAPPAGMGDRRPDLAPRSPRRAPVHASQRQVLRVLVRRVIVHGADRASTRDAEAPGPSKQSLSRPLIHRDDWTPHEPCLEDLLVVPARCLLWPIAHIRRGCPRLGDIIAARAPRAPPQRRQRGGRARCGCEGRGPRRSSRGADSRSKAPTTSAISTPWACSPKASRPSSPRRPHSAMRAPRPGPSSSGGNGR